MDFSYVYSLLVLCLVSPNYGLHSDLITSLPGYLGDIPFLHYSGYLWALNGKRLFYYFAESQRDPDNDPVAVWFTGGPGCSSMVAMLSENGPFKVTENGTSLVTNEFSWNRQVNMLWIESPAGVGFSYSNNRKYDTGDNDTAANNLAALKFFFSFKHPKYSTNDFYITGESYAGIYVPTLANLVIQHSNINLKGISIGNGLLDEVMNSNTLIQFAYSHGMWDRGFHFSLMESCCPGNKDISACDFISNRNKTCLKKIIDVTTIIMKQNIYNIYGKCYNRKTSELFRNKFLFSHIQSKRNMDTSPKKEATIGCDGHQAFFTWLNLPEVRRSLHVPNYVQQWQLVNEDINKKYKTEYTSMADIILFILRENKYKILIYNGDVDMACNFLGGERFVDSLQLQLTKKRHTWFYEDDQGWQQHAGFSKTLGKLQFKTVQGSGHMVPTDKPRAALHMFNEFIDWNP